MIYFIRHGEAAARWGSHPDPGLSDLGREQAETVAETLSELGIERVYSSPMARCQETARAFATKSGLEMVIEPKVTEIPTPDDVTDRVPWLQNLMSGHWADAPDLVQAWRSGLIDTVSALPPNTAVFSHFVAINAVVGHLDGTDQVTVFKPNYCSVTRLSVTDTGVTLAARGASLETKVL
ncbi:MAG: histidine phosphatase family protein [Pseudomonadota bacterium]